ncbi:MAG: hypothetical protein HKM07_03985 [Chlamydiae bacterium]|nr:hypothetical protein [Chlamydiota bacterium]
MLKKVCLVAIVSGTVSLFGNNPIETFPIKNTLSTTHEGSHMEITTSEKFELTNPPKKIGDEGFTCKLFKSVFVDGIKLDYPGDAWVLETNSEADDVIFLSNQTNGNKCTISLRNKDLRNRDDAEKKLNKYAIHATDDETRSKETLTSSPEMSSFTYLGTEEGKTNAFGRVAYVLNNLVVEIEVFIPANENTDPRSLLDDCLHLKNYISPEIYKNHN